MTYEEPEGTAFVEPWCSDGEKSAIQFSLERVKGLDGLNMEIGCFEGRSAVFTANLIDPEQLICIDPWVPVHYSDYEIKAYSERPIFETFKRNMEVGTKGNYRAYKTKYEDWFQDNSDLLESGIKYVYLDGPHAYADVLLGLETVVPHIVAGGVMVGDDYDAPEVQWAVRDFFGKELTHPKNDRTFEWVNV